jgi:hypothetical protein
MFSVVEEMPMSTMIVVSAVLTVALLLYLALVVAKPEWFQ